jgi:hypothetical protein
VLGCGDNFGSKGLGGVAETQLPVLSSGFIPLGQHTPHEFACEAGQQEPSINCTSPAFAHGVTHLLPRLNCPSGHPQVHVQLLVSLEMRI